LSYKGSYFILTTEKFGKKTNKHLSQIIPIINVDQAVIWTVRSVRLDKIGVNFEIV